MSKALTDAAELAGAVDMGALAFFDPAVLALPGYGNFMVLLGMTGLATEFGVIVDAITQNRGQNIVLDLLMEGVRPCT